MMVPPVLFPRCDQLVADDADGAACESFMTELPELKQGLLRCCFRCCSRSMQTSPA